MAEFCAKHDKRIGKIDFENALQQFGCTGGRRGLFLQ
jgi:hypothetical protein